MARKFERSMMERGDCVETGNCLIVCEDSRKAMGHFRENTFDCVVTSPPYWRIRDFGNKDQIGLESTAKAYADVLENYIAQVQRILKPTGTLWLNLGNTWKNGALVPIPWVVGLRLMQAGWILIQDIIWYKHQTLPMPASRKCVPAHEYVLMFAKSKDYYFDKESIRQNPKWEYSGQFCSSRRIGKGSGNPRKGPNFKKKKFKRIKGGLRKSVWLFERTEGRIKSMAKSLCMMQSEKKLHTATFPLGFAERCIKAGCPEGGLVLDPFAGTGTVGEAAQKLGRGAVLLELDPDYCEVAIHQVEREIPKWQGKSGIERKSIREFGKDGFEEFGNWSMKENP